MTVLLLLLAALVIPLGLDLSMPVPEENPLTVERIEVGRRLFNDRRLSRDEDVVDLYDAGGRANPSLDPELRPLHLSDAEKSSLVAFLQSLSGTVVEGFGGAR